MGVGTADILYQPGFIPGLPSPPPLVYATAAALGLLPGDDIDALAVKDPFFSGARGVLDATDVVWISLTPASPTLAIMGASPAAVIEVSPVAPPIVAVPPAALGLLGVDDLNAMTQLAGGPLGNLGLGLSQPGDFDGDGDVDLRDHAGFAELFTGPVCDGQGACCLAAQQACAVTGPCQCQAVGGDWSEGLTCEEVVCGTAAIAGARSCMDHGGSEWCLELVGTGGTLVLGDNIEPRLAGMSDVEFDLDLTAGTVSASVSCDVDTGYAPTVTVSPDMGTTIRVQLAPPMPNQDCCTITLTGGAEDSFRIITLVGDVDRDGAVTAGDEGLVQGELGNPLDAANFHFDVSADGLINPLDVSMVQSRTGNTAPACPP